MTDARREIIKRIINEEVDPDLWHAAPDRAWTLARGEQGGLIYQCDTELGLVTFVVHEPERAAEKLLAWSEDFHRVLMTGPDGETIMGTEAGDDLNASIEANALIALHYLVLCNFSS